MKKSNFRRWNFFLSRISNTIKLIKKKIKRDLKYKTYQVLVADITHDEMRCTYFSRLSPIESY